jgi:signal transduction histidine kinase
MPDEKIGHSPKPSLGTEEPTGFLDLSQKILLCANRSRPTVEFLIEVSEILVSHFACDALELWLKEKDACARWEATRNPIRFYRLPNATFHELDVMISKGTFFGDRIEETSSLASMTDCQSLASVPLMVGDEVTGLLVAKSNQADFFSEVESRAYRRIAQTVAVALAYQKVQLAQRERVKELTCLYEIAKATARPSGNLEEILQELVEYLPPAWQYPEITIARIALDNSTCLSKKYAASKVLHKQEADIVLERKKRGVVEVAYSEDRPELDEGPFLVEERRLIDTVAREVAQIVHREEAALGRAKLEEQLRHADRLATIGQLSAGVAHELNEPLGGILGFAQLTSKNPNLPEQALTDLQKIEAAALHAREVVRKLMLFARQTPPSKKKLSLNNLVEEGLYFIESRCAKAGIELERSLADELPEVTVDPAQIHQVLINLMVNAIQSMETGGKLTVATYRSKDTVSLSVTDTGPGMAADVVEKIFVPFFTTKDIGEGTGLGLPVVHGIVKSHGGEIDVHSQPGQGTGFVIRLPLESNALSEEVQQT